MSSNAEAVICGAGIAGIAAAYHLAVKQGMRDVVLVEAGDPLALTSDKSTECYRNWWPGPGDAMVGLMNRSIDLLEEIAAASDNRIGLNRRGYLYATADPARVADFAAAAEEAAALGAGPVRYYRGQPADPPYIPAPASGYAGQPDGADIITDPALIREHFGYLATETVAVLHARRCGWFSAQQLGRYMLEHARAQGVRLLRGQVTGVEVAGGRVAAVQVATGAGSQTIATPHFVNAAGPMQQAVGRMLGVELPVFAELHIKVAFNDHLAAVPRHAPLLIWTDPTPLVWTAAERTALAGSAETRHLLEVFPSGVHARPEGGGDSDVVLILWTYDTQPVGPDFPFAVDPEYPEIALRGLAAMLPALRGYLDHMPRPVVDGGYYIKTQENRPLIGPLPVEGAYILGALSGFGLMAACGAGELLAAHITGAELPAYAPAFALSRYSNPEYRRLLANWGSSGQL